MCRADDRTVPAATDPGRTSALRDFGDIFGALDRLPIPVFAIARNGVIRWLNMAAEEIVGDQRGTPYVQLVAPESRAVVRDAFATKLVGGSQSTDYEAVLIKKDGSRANVEICSVPVDDGGGIAGVFGAVAIHEDDEPAAPQRVDRPLTARQAEVLRYLGRGYSTDDMAQAMGVTRETVRNHVRSLLQRLDAHSRLEAVTIARLRGLL